MNEVRVGSLVKYFDRNITVTKIISCWTHKNIRNCKEYRGFYPISGVLQESSLFCDAHLNSGYYKKDIKLLSGGRIKLK